MGVQIGEIFIYTLLFVNDWIPKLINAFKDQGLETNPENTQNLLNQETIEKGTIKLSKCDEEYHQDKRNFKGTIKNGRFEFGVAK